MTPKGLTVAAAATALAVTAAVVSLKPAGCVMRAHGTPYENCTRRIPAGRQLPPRATITHVVEGAPFPRTQAVGDCVPAVCPEATP